MFKYIIISKKYGGDFLTTEKLEIKEEKNYEKRSDY